MIVVGVGLVGLMDFLQPLLVGSGADLPCSFSSLPP